MWVFLVPGCMDVGSTILQTSALAFISSSTYMMLKGASIITTLYFSRTLIAMPVHPRHVAAAVHRITWVMRDMNESVLRPTT